MDPTLIEEYHKAGPDGDSRLAMIHKLPPQVTSKHIKDILTGKQIEYQRVSIRRRQDETSYVFIELDGSALEACQLFNFNSPSIQGTNLTLSIAQKRNKSSHLSRPSKSISFGGVVDGSASKEVQVYLGATSDNIRYKVCLTYKLRAVIAELKPCSEGFSTLSPSKGEYYLVNNIMKREMSRCVCLSISQFRCIDLHIIHPVDPTVYKWYQVSHFNKPSVGLDVSLFGIEVAFGADKALEAEMRRLSADTVNMKCFGQDEAGFMRRVIVG